MLTRTEKLEFLKTAISELKHIKNNNLTMSESDNLFSFKLDSLDIVELQMIYEEQTGNTTSNPTQPIKTVGDLLDIML